jgi:DNA invertase Pin-like site-specific DNA recombinase
MAVIAQRDREMIAQRTREALAVARKRLAEQGKALGNPAAALRRAGRGNTAAIAAVGAAADKRAEDLRETIIDACAMI